jgi:predicted flap endonuclease-1-like 5' DNA nuclease
MRQPRPDYKTVKARSLDSQGQITSHSRPATTKQELKSVFGVADKTAKKLLSLGIANIEDLR